MTYEFIIHLFYFFSLAVWNSSGKIWLQNSGHGWRSDSEYIISYSEFNQGYLCAIVSVWIISWVWLGFGLHSAVCGFNTLFRSKISWHNIRHSCGVSCGQFITPLLAELMTIEYGWRGCLLIQAAITANITIAGALLRPVPSMTPKHKTTSSSNNLFTNKAFIALLIHSGSFSMAISIVLVHLANGVAKFTGVDSELSALAIAIFGVSNLFGRLVHSVISKLPRVNAMLQYLVSYTIIAACMIFVLPSISSYTVMCVIIAVLSFFLAPYGCLLLIIVMNLVGLQKSVVAYGYINFVCGIEMFIGAPIAGCLFDYTSSYSSSMYFGGGTMLLSVLLLLPWATSRTKRMGEYVLHIVDYQNEEIHDIVGILMI